MSRTFLCGFTAVAMTAFVWSTGDVHAGALGGSSPDSLDLSSGLCPVAAPVVLAQAKLQMKKQMQFRVPSGENYVMRPGQTTFDKIAGGVVLEGTDCVKITCPSTFDPDVTCWECHESLTTEN